MNKGGLYIDSEKLPEQQKKVEEKEKGEKNVDCCYDKEDCPRQGRDSKSVDLVIAFTTGIL